MEEGRFPGSLRFVGIIVTRKRVDYGDLLRKYGREGVQMDMITVGVGSGMDGLEDRCGS